MNADPPSSFENPLQASANEPEAIRVNSGRREDLRTIAICQKGIDVCILVYLLAILNGKARRKNGVRAGLIGADFSQV